MARPLPKICLAADHAGYRLKEEIAEYLRLKGYLIEDFGAFSAKNSRDDYPDFILPAAQKVAKSKGRALGIFFGGSGLGECLAANKVKGIRAVAAYDRFTARKSREHNDANVLALGSRTRTGDSDIAKRLVSLWLTTPFSGEPRHRRRLKKISEYESRRH